VLQSSNGSTIILYSSEFHRTRHLRRKPRCSMKLKLWKYRHWSTNTSATGWSRRTCIDSLSDQTIDTQIEQLSGTPSVDAAPTFSRPARLLRGPRGYRLSHRALWIQGLAKKLRHPCRYNQTTCMLSTTVPLFSRRWPEQHIGGLARGRHMCGTRRQHIQWL
jgi:hypothetical protein